VPALEKVTFLDDPQETVIATVSVPRGFAELEEADAEAAAAEAAEGEEGVAEPGAEAEGAGEEEPSGSESEE